MIFISRLPLIFFLKKTAYGQNVSPRSYSFYIFVLLKNSGEKTILKEKIEHLEAAKQPKNPLFSKLCHTNQNSSLQEKVSVANKPAGKQRAGLIVRPSCLQDSDLAFQVVIGSVTTCFGHWK